MERSEIRNRRSRIPLARHAGYRLAGSARVVGIHSDRYSAGMFEAKFQSFDVEDIPRAQIAARVAALRAELSRRGLDGFVVPRADRQQDEYLPPSEERLKWLTGFSGSAGVAVVLTERAALFVDGRYTLQARDQVDTALFSIEHLIDSPPHVWLEGNLKPGAKLGYDSWLHTVGGAEKLA